MRLEITGNITEVEDTFNAAFIKWIEKIEAESPEMADSLLDCCVKVTGMTFDLQFKPVSADDWQVLTTDNHEGIPELLVVKAETDDDGNLLWDTVKDNDGDSNFSEVEAIITAGTQGITDKPEIESVYADKVPVKSEVFSMFNGVTVNVIETAEETVVQAYVLQDTAKHSEPKLISEVAFPLESFSELTAHYAELAEL